MNSEHTLFNECYGCGSGDESVTRVQLYKPGGGTTLSRLCDDCKADVGVRGHA